MMEGSSYFNINNSIEAKSICFFVTVREEIDKRCSNGIGKSKAEEEGMIVY